MITVAGEKDMKIIDQVCTRLRNQLVHVPEFLDLAVHPLTMGMRNGRGALTSM
jgi:hypothetical protein